MCLNSVSEGCLRMRQEASLHGRSVYNLFCNSRWECSSCRGSFISTGLCPELRLYSQLKYVHQQLLSFTAELHSSPEVSKSILQLWGVSSQANPAGLNLHCPAAYAVSSAHVKWWQDPSALVRYDCTHLLYHFFHGEGTRVMHDYTNHEAAKDQPNILLAVPQGCAI